MTAELVGLKPDVGEYLAQYRELGLTFEVPPVVNLRLISQAPAGREPVGARDIAATAAIQCYAPGIAPMKARPDDKAQSIADSTLEAGHHTTRMHAHYTFLLVGATRDVVHDIFHGNPFYNSEQQSQRYVEARAGNYAVPTVLTSEQREFYVGAAERSNQAYFEMLEGLKPEVERRIREMYPKSGWSVGRTRERLESKVVKVSQEVARYVLPIAQKTTMYHTLNELQLLRLWRGSQMGHFSDEARFIIGQMVEGVVAEDSTFLSELDLPIEKRVGGVDTYVNEQNSEFDALLKGRLSRLIGNAANVRLTLADSARGVLGVSSWSSNNTKTLDFLMNPKKNPYLADVYEIGMFDPLTSVLRQASFTFATKLSHTADSQRQRHRRTPGATPPIFASYDGSFDYITPMVIEGNAQLNERYDLIMRENYEAVERAREMGIPDEWALRLLPNAHALRVVESGDLFDWLHRLKQRLCYLAQEEIFFISVDQAEQLTGIFPESTGMFQAPCGVAQVAGTGKCPEGDRWCGQPVWKWKIDQYKKGRLV
ncbi:hypothetical protein A2961_03380 [Candidatus Woesebacteria bacterium RIFCSPLOWO2_01_FULL_39_21]|uniref:Thymidylate synthase n=1 Tax=Candidatus Woesebacteria bacterium RIFCSPLOWO2_01_FULL_39_21 TaxID=1802519 RepID=A0A1F8BGU6_9BACT|nr:MAG: hypothetical protein A2961_03380 [Candidatus Woesebacteria bacterium RIFCSPLOWO2_01_FULL_39_21]